MTILLAFIGLLNLLDPGQDHVLTVRVDGMETYTGQFLVAIYNSDETFMDDKNSFERKVIPIGDQRPFTFQISLPNGQYAISLFQDLNSDNALNKNFVGIPREPYGFSNNPAIRFGPPDFEETSFEMKDSKVIFIQLQ